MVLGLFILALAGFVGSIIWKEVLIHKAIQRREQREQK